MSVVIDEVHLLEADRVCQSQALSLRISIVPARQRRFADAT
jgi:hypothetical protein